MTFIDIKAPRYVPKNKEKLLDMVKGENKIVKFTMRMDADLHRKFKVFAIKNELPMAEIIHSILLNYMKNNPVK